MHPVLQSKSSIGDLIYFTDLEDSLLFYSPRLLLDPLQEQKIGTKHLFQGGGKYGLTQGDMAALLAAKPNLQRQPIDAQYTIDDPFSELLKGHIYKLQLLPQIPFPSFIFSATLDTSSPDYEKASEALLSGWAELFVEAMQVSMSVLDVEVLFKWEVDNSSFKRRREEELPRAGISNLALSGFVRQCISDGLLILETPIGGQAAMSLCEESLFEFISKVHFFRDFNGVVLDDATKISLFGQQVVRQTDPISKYFGVKSSISRWEWSI